MSCSLSFKISEQMAILRNHEYSPQTKGFCPNVSECRIRAYIYGNTNLYNITKQGLLINRECKNRTQRHSVGDSVNALKTVQSLFLFQYKVSSSREKSYCELKSREEILLRNFLLSKPVQLC